MRPVLAFVAGLGFVAAPAVATTLEDAIGAALRHAPVVDVVDAERDAASARLTQAWGAALPSGTVSGTYGTGRLDPKNFFGLGAADVKPRAAQVVVEQPLFAGGRIVAGIRQAREGVRAAGAARTAARLQLVAGVAEAYGNVLAVDRLVALYTRLDDETGEILRQATLRFDAGEAASTDVAQAKARKAEAEAGLARARGMQVSARAHFVNLVGMEPENLAPLPANPALPETFDAALLMAMGASPALVQAEAAERSARSAATAAKGELLPSVSAFAEAATVRDQFFPDYRADSKTVGVRARWEIPAGRTWGHIRQAGAEARAAEARLRDARQQVEEQLISAFQNVRTAELVERAASDQAAAAQMALTSVRHEVRVALKPQIDLLDAEREAIGAEVAAAQARTDRIVAAYRLKALLGQD